MLKYAKLRELTHSHISVQLKPIACVDECLLGFGKIKDIGNIKYKRYRECIFTVMSVVVSI